MQFLDSLERLFIVKAKEVAKGNEIEEKAMARIFKFFDVDGSGVGNFSVLQCIFTSSVCRSSTRRSLQWQ